MIFEVAGKVALITGASSGLGYHIAKSLLQHELKGVAIIDIDEKKGQKVKEEFTNEFGPGRCIFIKTDVSKTLQLEDAFKQTLSTFKQLDVVINNAAIISELNWKECLNVNLGGCLAGTKLAIDNYLPKYKSGPEAVIINIASVVGLQPLGVTPVYTTTKHGIVALGRAYGMKEHYDKTKVRVLTICPGHMNTALISRFGFKDFNWQYIRRFSLNLKEFPIQKAEFVAESLLDIMKTGQSGSVWVIEGGEPAYEVEFRDRFSMRKK